MLKVIVLDAKSLPLVELSIFGTFESILLTNTLKKKHPRQAKWTDMNSAMGCSQSVSCTANNAPRAQRVLYLCNAFAM